MEISFKLIGSFMSHETKISCLPGSHVKMEPGKGGGLCWRGGGAREIRSPRRGYFFESYLGCLAAQGVQYLIRCMECHSNQRFTNNLKL